MLLQVEWFLSRTDESLRVVRVKNKFALAREELVGGFRDLMLSLLFTGLGGLRIIGEVQVSLLCFLLHKSKKNILETCPLILTFHLSKCCVVAK